MKRSRQRESIMNFLAGRTDHPTAVVIYTNLRQEMPNLSLGTVYRNLSLLSDIGDILKISTGNGPDHFDGNPTPHNHFICNKCGAVIDLEMDNIEHIDEVASKNFDGNIQGHVIYFHGICPDCLKQEKTSS